MQAAQADQAAQAAATQAAQLAFSAALGRIGLAPNIQQEIITYTGCINIGMLGLMTPDDVTKMCKTFRTRPANPLQITVTNVQTAHVSTMITNLVRTY